jgi:dihydroflavonol-4-reductase
MAKYWVGGATGFLGAQLTRSLLSRGHEVVAASRGGEDVEGARGVAVDVLDAARVEATAKGADGAFLSFGKVSRNPADAEELHRLHVWGTRAALRCLRAAGVPRVVVASTSGTLAVGTDPHAVYDESSPRPLEHLARWPYYRSKYYAELEALEANAPGFEIVIVNPSLLLGPGDLRGSSTEDVCKFLNSEIAAVPKGGLSFVDFRDAAEAMVFALERGKAGEQYLLAGANLTVAAFFGRLERVTGVPAPRLPLPSSRFLAVEASRLFSRAVKAIGGEAPVDAESVELAVHYWYASSVKAEKELGFSPRSPVDTLRDTVDDLVARGVAQPRTGYAADADRGAAAQLEALLAGGDGE